MKLRAAALGLSAILLWSTNAVVAKHALAQLSVPQVMTFQFAGASLVFLLIRLWEPRQTTTGRSTAVLMLGTVGLVGTVVFQYLAFSFGPIAITNMLAYAWPLLTALLFILSGSSSMPGLLTLVSAVGFVGVALIIGAPDLPQQSAGTPWGYVFAVGSAIFMAAYSIGIARIRQSPTDALVPASLFGLVVMGIWWAASSGAPLTINSVFAAVYLGLGPMGLGYLLWSYAMKMGQAGPLSTLGYATPVLSTVLLVISGEHLSGSAILGCVLIVICCAIAGTMETREERHAPPTTSR